MSISALTSRFPETLPTPAEGRPVHAREQARTEFVPEPTLASLPATSRGSMATPALSTHAPAGTDPKLWSVLTNVERAWFLKAEHAGPLTYSRVMTGTADGANGPVLQARRGARVDLRV